MIEFKGTLSIKEIKGRKGAFSVGELATEIGTFKVKDQILDQYEEGKYRGRFLVSQIFPDSYVYYGRVITEVRATVADIFLDEVDTGPGHEEARPAEPDPIDLQASQPEQAASASPAAELPAADSLPASVEQGAAPVIAGDIDVELFGAEIAALIAEGKTLKLDPTVDRTLFREQRDRLKNVLGYGFQAESQTWSKR